MDIPILYHCDDLGAPQREEFETGPNGIAAMNNLKRILVACLVNGYGDKPAAGWTLEQDHPNGFVLGNARGDFFFNVVAGLPEEPPLPSMHEDTVHYYTANSYIDTGTGKMDGINLCSGTYRKTQAELSGYPRHGSRSHYHPWYNNTQRNSATWCVIADGNTFTISSSSVYSNSSSYGISYTSNTCSCSLYVGDFIQTFQNDIPTPIVLTGHINSYSNSGDAGSYGGQGYSAPISPYSLLDESHSIGISPLVDLSSSLNPQNYGHKYKQFNFEKPRVICNGVDVGELKGHPMDISMFMKMHWQGWMEVLGLGDDYQDRNNKVSFDGYSLIFSRRSGGNLLLSDHPDFWN